MTMMEDLAKFLEGYGGWGIAVVMMFVVVYLYRDFKKVVDKKDLLIQQINEKHHNEIVEVIKECIGVLTSVDESLDRCEARQEKKI